jgi:hypothetical protein
MQDYRRLDRSPATARQDRANSINRRQLFDVPFLLALNSLRLPRYSKGRRERHESHPA